jgi:hypothetical protein
MNTQLQLNIVSDLAQRLIAEAAPHKMFLVQVPFVPSVGESYQLGFHLVEGISGPPKGHEYYWRWVTEQTPILATILIHDPIVKEEKAPVVPEKRTTEQQSDFKIATPSIPKGTAEVLAGAFVVVLGAVLLLTLDAVVHMALCDPYLCVLLPTGEILCIEQWNEEVK